MPVSKKDIDYRYDHSPKGIERRRRVNASKKGHERIEKFYAKHGGQPAYRREQYHRIQDEAGCHSQPRDFYPGYRILKALETAEIVEI